VVSFPQVSPPKPCICFSSSSHALHAPPIGLLGLRIRNTRGHGCLSLVSVVCCQVEVSAMGWSLIQRSSNECGSSERDRESSITKRPCSTRGCRKIKKKCTRIQRNIAIPWLIKVIFLLVLMPWVLVVWN
jgi:hypothetical protein